MSFIKKKRKMFRKPLLEQYNLHFWLFIDGQQCCYIKQLKDCFQFVGVFQNYIGNIKHCWVHTVQTNYNPSLIKGNMQVQTFCFNKSSKISHALGCSQCLWKWRCWASSKLLNKNVFGHIQGSFYIPLLAFLFNPTEQEHAYSTYKLNIFIQSDIISYTKHNLSL